MIKSIMPKIGLITVKKCGKLLKMNAWIGTYLNLMTIMMNSTTLMIMGTGANLQISILIIGKFIIITILQIDLATLTDDLFQARNSNVGGLAARLRDRGGGMGDNNPGMPMIKCKWRATQGLEALCAERSGIRIRLEGGTESLLQ
jgi:hypothetical protein